MTQPRFPRLIGWFTPRAAPPITGEISPTPRWVDAALLQTLAAVGYGVMRAAAEWRAPLVSGMTIDLSLGRLPYYAGLSTLRMTIAYVISLAFSLIFARVAAGSRAAERIMLPLLDILQSIPILSFMPGVVLGLAALFPGRTLGLELAAIILIFTSQAWNLAFSFHQSLITIPRELPKPRPSINWGRGVDSRSSNFHSARSPSSPIA